MATEREVDSLRQKLRTKQQKLQIAKDELTTVHKDLGEIKMRSTLLQNSTQSNHESILSGAIGDSERHYQTMVATKPNRKVTFNNKANDKIEVSSGGEDFEKE